MTKILHVIKPFFVMEVGDTLELSENGMYESSYENKYSASDAEDTEISSVYSSNYSISKSYAAELIREGYLVEDNENKETKPYVNVFDEIDYLLKDYKNDLDNLDDDCSDAPACIRVERETVLSNLVKVLEHLQSLKK